MCVFVSARACACVSNPLGVCIIHLESDAETIHHNIEHFAAR